MEWFLILLFLFVITSLLNTNNGLFNVNFLVMGPFVILIVINNWFAARYGFYTINNDVITITAFVIILFYTGSLFCRFILGQSIVKQSINKDYQLNIKLIKVYVVIVLLLRLVELLIKFFTGGLAYMTSNDFETMRLNGPIGHLFISAYPLLAVLFYNGLKEKNKINILIVSLGIFLAFLSFTKYHVISMVLLIYLYISFKNKVYFLKGGIITLVSVIALFILGYLGSFLIKDSNVDALFYPYHTWGYIAGGTINFNLITTQGLSGYNIIDWLINSFMALPNMFINYFYGHSINPEYIELGFRQIGNYYGQSPISSNVVNFIGLTYALENILLFILIMFLLGFISEFIFNLAVYRKEENLKLFASVFMTFCLLLFFGNYFSLSMTWELLIYSFLLPGLFKKRRNIKNNLIIR
ncbi:DUF6337 family protein [Virgibacillus doumboii]|uniref:DUF6337 family protein n=1 Tax=Virgibacillus doumboii TaxID=2697503 RepID=UPI0013DFA3A7|nr:DUF6337 family protein [Virgibacillus doumboii]